MDRVERIIFLRLVVAGLKNLLVFAVAILLAFLLSLVCGCKGCDCMENVTDSIGMELRVWTVEVPCTVYYNVPFISEKVSTRDTSSRLENPFAVSEAWTDSAGLHHTLATKPQKIEVPTTVQEVHKESAKMRTRVITKVIKERKDWKYYCKASLVLLGCVFVGFIVGWIARMLKKK